MADPDPTPSSTETLLADAVIALEQRGEAGLQEFLARHAGHALAIHDGLERLRRMGVLAPPPVAPEAVRQFGEFRVLRRLAAGGMGVVYLAEQTSLKRQVALKVVRPELLMSETARSRFQREVETIARLQHPGIVPILAVGSEGAQPWFAMEYVEGRSLEAMLDTVKGGDLARSAASVLRSALGGSDAGASTMFHGGYWEACVRIVAQVAQAMSYVHARGIVHRDLKPSNIMVTAQGQALVLDFGLAHVQDRERVTRTDAPVGSPAYMAPEQVRGDAVDERVDVYGLGVTLWQALSGELPFQAASPEALRQLILAGDARGVRAHNRAVPRDLEIVCAVAMDRERERRYRSMADFAADLDAVLARRPIRARAPGLLLRAARACQRHPTLATIAAAVLVVALQFPVFLWRREAAMRQELTTANERLAVAGQQQAATNQQLATANTELRAQRQQAVANLDDAMVALQELLVRTSQSDLVSTPGSEVVRLGILQRANELFEHLRQRRPGEAAVETNAARVLQYLGSVHGTMGQWQKAEACYRDALARLSAVSGDEAQLIRGVTHRKLGVSLSERGEQAAAEAELRVAGCELEGVAMRSLDPEAQRHASEVKNSLAIVRRLRGDAAEELQLLLAAQAAKRAALAQAPADVAAANAFALGCASLAPALARAGRGAEALAEVDAGIAALVRLLPAGDRAVDYRTRLALLHERRASLRESGKDLDGAERDHGVALALRLELVAEYPAVAAHHAQAGATMHNLAMLLRAQRQYVRSETLEAEGVQRLREALRLQPQRREAALHLEYTLAGQATCLLDLGRFPELLGVADALAAAAVTAEGALSAGRLLARCAAHTPVPGPEGAEALRTRAVAAIEKAVALGFRDAEHFESERWASYYDDLRSMPAFEALLTKLRAGH